MTFSKRSSQSIYNKISICNSSQLTYCIHFFFMTTLLLRTYHGSKILQFDTGSSFLLKIHIIFYRRYAKFNVFQKLSQRLIVNSLKNLWINSVVSFLCSQLPELTILNSHKNVNKCLFNYEDINRKKKTLTSLTSFFANNPFLSPKTFPVWKKAIKVW